jgi:hypothetical protein
MTVVMGRLSVGKQDQAKAILRNVTPPQNPPPPAHDAWTSINSGIEALGLDEGGGEPDLLRILSTLALPSAASKSYPIADLHAALKDASDTRLLDHHK